MKIVRFYLLMGLIFSVWTALAIPTTNGLYAGFTTSKGTFYCLLRYDLAPRTVANFVSLADGSKTWLDFSQGVVQRPFYTGLKFHRVVTNFVIQGGSPNGQGTDGPGYTFNNEITSLNHNSAGTLAMANSGGTNSNGSQFYVTLTPQPGLNGGYSVFGNVVEGMNVVSNIGAVAINTNTQQPLVPVIISNVTILRIGTAASNFNAFAVSPPLPVVRLKAQKIEKLASLLHLAWQPTTNFEYRVFYSFDLKTWTYDYQGFASGLYFDTSVSNFPKSVFFSTSEFNFDF